MGLGHDLVSQVRAARADKSALVRHGGEGGKDAAAQLEEVSVSGHRLNLQLARAKLRTVEEFHLFRSHEPR